MKVGCIVGKQNESVKQNKTKVDKTVGVILSRHEMAARIKRLRESSGLTAEQFAKECGVSEVTQYAYEGGRRAPDTDYLLSLHEKRGVDLSHLITGRELESMKGLSAQEVESIARYRELPPKIQKTIDDVLLLAWLAYKDRKPYHDADDKPVASETTAAKTVVQVRKRSRRDLLG